MYVSGQIPMTTDGAIPRQPAEQAALTFANVGRALAAADAAWGDVVKLTIYVTDMAVLDALRTARDAVIDHRSPAGELARQGCRAGPARPAARGRGSRRDPDRQVSSGGRALGPSG